MKFIIGGEFQGKLSYALKLQNVEDGNVIDGSVGSLEEMCYIPIINNFNLFIKRLIEDNKSLETIKSYVDIIIHKNPDVIIISNEIGYGVVPINKSDRLYRESVGRVSSEIAKKSKEVHRVICGIGTIIKGENND